MASASATTRIPKAQRRFIGAPVRAIQIVDNGALGRGERSRARAALGERRLRTAAGAPVAPPASPRPLPAASRR